MVSPVSGRRGESVGTLILLRHGQSVANAAGVFTGWLDVELTAEGRREAVAAGRCLAAAGVHPDVVHTSLLSRAIVTADLVINQLPGPAPSAGRTWRLNERHYGALTGLRKADVRAEVGETLYVEWRNSLQVAPPPLTPAGLRRLSAGPWPTWALAGNPTATESLGDVVARVVPYWLNTIAPRLAAGSTVLVVAHGNSLRALVAYLDHLSQAELSAFRLPTAKPVLYTFTDALVPLPRRQR
jgi:2,3-bisphosphoglycerate-dependent phosphoglycerate mutase